MATELTDGVWRIACRGVNAYLLDGETAGLPSDETVLVDAGTPLDAGHVRAGVADAGFDLAAVDRVLLTHYDFDHAGSLWRLDDELTATLHAPQPDLGHLTRETSLPWSSKGAFQRVLRVAVRPPALDVVPVADGDEVAGLTAHRTPGHTLGHTAYVGAGVALLGDLVFGDDGGYAEPSGFVNEDTARNRESIRSLADADAVFEVGCQGHGDPVVGEADAALSSLADRIE